MTLPVLSLAFDPHLGKKSGLPSSGITPWLNSVRIDCASILEMDASKQTRTRPCCPRGIAVGGGLHPPNTAEACQVGSDDGP